MKISPTSRHLLSRELEFIPTEQVGTNHFYAVVGNGSACCCVISIWPVHLLPLSATLPCHGHTKWIVRCRLLQPLNRMLVCSLRAATEWDASVHDSSYLSAAFAEQNSASMHLHLHVCARLFMRVRGTYIYRCPTQSFPRSYSDVPCSAHSPAVESHGAAPAVHLREVLP